MHFKWIDFFCIDCCLLLFLCYCSLLCSCFPFIRIFAVNIIASFINSHQITVKLTSLYLVNVSYLNSPIAILHMAFSWLALSWNLHSNERFTIEVYVKNKEIERDKLKIWTRTICYKWKEGRQEHKIEKS